MFSFWQTITSPHEAVEQTIWTASANRRSIFILIHQNCGVLMFSRLSCAKNLLIMAVASCCLTAELTFLFVTGKIIRPVVTINKMERFASTWFISVANSNCFGYFSKQQQYDQSLPLHFEQTGVSLPNTNVYQCVIDVSHHSSTLHRQTRLEFHEFYHQKSRFSLISMGRTCSR